MTGVQTCALPIWRLFTPSASPILLPSGGWVLRAIDVPDPSTRTCLDASGIPPLLPQKARAPVFRNTLRVELVHILSQMRAVRVQAYFCCFSKTFLLQEFVQVATSGAENRPAWPSLGRRTKRAEYQSLDADVRPNSWAMLAESSYGQGDSGCVEERFLCTKSDIFRN